jgi:hypothetical protein
MDKGYVTKNGWGVTLQAIPQGSQFKARFICPGRIQVVTGTFSTLDQAFEAAEAEAEKLLNAPPQPLRAIKEEETEGKEGTGGTN